MLLFDLWGLCCDQWLIRGEMPFALNMAVLPALLNDFEVDKKDHRLHLTKDLKCIAAGYLKGVYENVKKQSGNK